MNRQQRPAYVVERERIMGELARIRQERLDAELRGFVRFQRLCSRIQQNGFQEEQKFGPSVPGGGYAFRFGAGVVQALLRVEQKEKPFRIPIEGVVGKGE